MPRSVVTWVSGLLLAALLAGAWVLTRSSDARDPIVSAVSAAPADAISVRITAWSRLEHSIDKAALEDLTSTSMAVEFANEFEDRLGWTLAELDWEANIVTPAGPVIVFGLGSLDADLVDDSWAALGKRDGNTWQVNAGGSSEFIANFTHVRVLHSAGLLVASSRPAALQNAVNTIRGREPSLMTDRGVAQLAQEATGHATVFFNGGPRLCFNPESGLDADETAALRQIERRHGALADPNWIMRALDPDPRRYLFGVSFDTDDDARQQADVRTALTEGPFLGRYGTVADTLRDRKVAVDGSTVTFDFEPTKRAEPYMVNSGPVLFSGCSVVG